MNILYKNIYALVFLTVFYFTIHTASAWTLSNTSHQVETFVDGYISIQDTVYDGDSWPHPVYNTICDVWGWGADGDGNSIFGCLSSHLEPVMVCAYYPQNAWSYFHYNYETDLPRYTDAACTVPAATPFYAFMKEAYCPAGEVMTGTSFYQWPPGIDEEHQDAVCTPLAGVTFGSSRWVTPVNAMWNGVNIYKPAACTTGEVMTGVRLFMIPSEIDEEHVDAYCTTVTGLTKAGASAGVYTWVTPVNGWWNGKNIYKPAVCPTGDVMVGTRWYQYPTGLDEEHTDAYCWTPPPQVNVWFSSLLEKLRKYL